MCVSGPVTRVVESSKKRGPPYLNLGSTLAACGGGVHLPHRDVQMPWAQDALERPCTWVALG